MDCLTVIVMVVVLGAIGWVIDLIVPGKMPFGWLGGVVAAIVGGLLGAFLFGSFGPAVRAFGWQLSIIPALLGAIILAVIVRFVMGMQRRNV